MIMRETDKKYGPIRGADDSTSSLLEPKCSRCLKRIGVTNPVVRLWSLDRMRVWRYCQACVKAEQDERDAKLRKEWGNEMLKL